jgi:hypothetical protein
MLYHEEEVEEDSVLEAAQQGHSLALQWKE